MNLRTLFAVFLGCASLAQALLAAEAPRFPFPTDRVVFDLARRTAYGLDTGARQLAKLNLESGEVQTTQLKLPPLVAALTPDGSNLWVGEGPIYDTPGWSTTGVLARIELPSGTLASETPLGFTPSDVTATDDLIAILAGTSWPNRAYIFDGRTGAITANAPLTSFSRVTLNPAQNTIFGLGLGNDFHPLVAATLDREKGRFTTFRQVQVAGETMTANTLIFSRRTGHVLAAPLGELMLMDAAAPHRFSPQARLEQNILTGAFSGNQTNVLAVAESGGIAFYRLDTARAIGRVSPTPLQPMELAFDGEVVHYAAKAGDSTVILSVPNLALGLETNAAPIARLAEGQAERAQPVLLDASHSSDHDQPTGLQYRWDLDGDGIFDTAFSADPTFTHTFRQAGTHRVSVEVQDRFAAASIAEQKVLVTPSAQSFYLPEPNDPFILPYPVQSGVFAQETPFFYFLPSGSNSVARLNLTNGLVDRAWSLPMAPLGLGISSDSKRLLVSYSTNDAPHLTSVRGWVAEIDLIEGAIVQEIPTGVIPYKVLAPASARQAIVHGEDPIRKLHSYDLATGQRLGAMNTYDQYVSVLLLNGSERVIYASAQDNNPSAMFRFPYDPQSGLFAGSSRTIPNEPGHGIYLLRNNTQLITANGHLFSASTNAAADLNLIKDLSQWPVGAMTEIPEKEIVALFVDEPWLLTPGKLVYYQNGFDSTFLTQQMERSTRFLTAFGGRIYNGWSDQTNTYFRSRPFPATSGQENSAPAIQVSAVPSTNDVLLGTEMYFDVSASDDDGAIAEIRFVVDGNEISPTVEGQPRYHWIAENSGLQTLRFEAIDNFGASASTNVQVLVNAPPSIELPSFNEQMISPITLEVQPVVSDPDGTVRSVAYYFYPRANPLLAIVTNAPFTLRVENFSSSGGSLQAVVTDDRGATNRAVVTLRNLLGLPGDEFFRPLLLEGTNTTGRANNTNATSQTGEMPAPGMASHESPSYWWAWTAPRNGMVHLSTHGSSFDTDLQVFRGTNFFGPTEAYNDDSPTHPPASFAKFYARAGQEYRFRVSSRYQRTGDIVLNLAQAPAQDFSGPPPANDLYANRIELSGDDLSLTGSNVGATFEPSERTHVPSNARQSVWWTWSSPVAGRVTVSTEGSDFDTVLAAYRDSGSLAALAPVDSNDDRFGTHSLIQFNASANTPYAIVVDGWLTNAGSIQLSISLNTNTAALPPNLTSANPIPVEGSHARILASILPVNGDPQTMVRWWEWTAPQNGKVTIAGRAWKELGVTESHSAVPIEVFREASGALEAVATWQTFLGAQFTAKSVTTFDAVQGEQYLISAGAHTPGFAKAEIVLLQTQPPLLLKFEEVRLHPEGLRIRTSDPGGSVIYESSTDLIHWSPISLSTEEGYLKLPNDGSHRFIRSLLR